MKKRPQTIILFNIFLFGIFFHLYIFRCFPIMDYCIFFSCTST